MQQRVLKIYQLALASSPIFPIAQPSFQAKSDRVESSRVQPTQPHSLKSQSSESVLVEGPFTSASSCLPPCLLPAPAHQSMSLSQYCLVGRSQRWTHSVVWRPRLSVRAPENTA
ncbi:hypothetical protein BDZ45DRAFT_671225 [Acephala macrosclerotiorum]|nr:hypothetical protein BDZ45DRAFT_671225 [Acephala macrosclerotiorum]